MTSKNSFWDSVKENHKRRIWVWLIAVLVQFISYPGVLMVYLSRIKAAYKAGAYLTVEAFQEGMYEGAQTALGTNGITMFIVIFLAAVVGMQGFSYLYDRKKVDMYHSVPVSKIRRFFVVYANGIVIYLASTLAAILAGVVIAAAQGAVNGTVLKNIAVLFFSNLLFFIALYNTMILAVMLTGNCLVTLCAYGVLLMYEPALYLVTGTYQYNFFRMKSMVFGGASPKFSVLYDYDVFLSDVRSGIAAARNGAGPTSLVKLALPYYGKWVLLAVIILAAALFCYRKRPSEAAGRAISFQVVQPFVKVAVSVLAAMGIGAMVYDASGSNDFLMFIGMLAGGVLCCAAMEIIYDFDIKSLFRHIVSSIVAAVCVLAVFFIFKEDLLGYDKYIPKQDKVESVAFYVESIYYRYWDDEMHYMGAGDYLREHMFVTDVEPMLALAERSVQRADDGVDGRSVDVLYRLKSGREVSRMIMVDFDDPEIAALMDQLTASDEYKSGTMPLYAQEIDPDSLELVSYTNGSAEVGLPAEDIQTLREAWRKDMEQFDFSMARELFPCGEIRFTFKTGAVGSVQFYECFENTIAYLKSQDAYYPLVLDASDIEEISVLNYHNEMYEQGYPGTDRAVDTALAQEASNSWQYQVEEVFTEKEQIEQILGHVYPNGLDYGWHDSSEFDNNYEVTVTFKRKTTYPCQRSSYHFWYRFYAGEVPEFVEQATALQKE